MCLKRRTTLNINHKIVPLFNDTNITTPHYLMELSTRYWRRVIENSTPLSDYTVTKVNNHKIVTYDDISYRSLIKPIKKRTTS